MKARILVAYDDSKSSARAIAFASALAKNSRSELHVIAVLRPSEIDAASARDRIVERTNRRYSRALQRLTGANATSRFEVVVGHPADQIVRYAEQNAVSHIVVGYGLRERFDRWLLSAAREVVAYAPCTVTVVRA